MPYSAEANDAWYQAERDLEAEAPVCEATREALAPFEERGDPSGGGNGVLYVRRSVNKRVNRIMDLGLAHPRVLFPKEWCEQPLIQELEQYHCWDEIRVSPEGHLCPSPEQIADDASDDPKERDLHLARCRLYCEMKGILPAQPSRDDE